MTPLEQLRAEQREEIRTQADEAWDAFMAEVSPITALADREPTTDIERRHLARVRRTA